MFHVPPQIQQSRLDACRQCKFSKQTPGIGLTCGTFLIGGKVEPENDVKYYRRKVRLCGCKMEWKSKYAFAKCPIGTWNTHNLDDEQIEILTTFVKSIENKSTVSADEVQKLFRWKNRITGRQEPVQYCGQCVKDLIRDINEALNKMTTLNPTK